MLIQIKSSDGSNISHQLGKNPSSPPRLKRLRKGTALGWYPQRKDNEYCLSFFDGHDEISYPLWEGQKYDHLEKQRLCSPLLPSKLLTNLLGKLPEQESGQVVEVCISSLRLSPREKETLEKLLRMTCEELTAGSSYHKICFTEKGLLNAVDKMHLLGAYLTLRQHPNLVEQVFGSGEDSSRLFQKMQRLQLPYFMWYLLTIRYCRGSTKRLQHIKEYLPYESCGLSNQEARIRECLNHVRDMTVLDFGAGEMQYAPRLARQNSMYYAYDKSEESSALAEKKIPYIDNAAFITNLDELPAGGVDAVIMSEVLEHNELHSCPGLLKTVFDKTRPKLMWMTTPNAAFNQYYDLEDSGGKRHHDHKWEAGSPQFRMLVESWMGSFLPADKFSVQEFAIGDKVNGVAPTQGLLVSFI